MKALRVACLGASVTEGTVSYNWVRLLGRKLGGDAAVFNGGKNGDLAWNLLKRLTPAIEFDPTHIVILVGSNDVMATMDPINGFLYRVWKRLPRNPSLKWYRECLEAIVQRLKKETNARVFLCSLPLLGEDLHSRSNVTVDSYNAEVRSIAAALGVGYIPVHEILRAELEKSASVDTRHSYTGSARLMYKAILQRKFFRRSWDDIAQGNGFVLSTDGIHLNSRAGELVEQAVESALRETSAAVA